MRLSLRLAAGLAAALGLASAAAAASAKAVRVQVRFAYDGGLPPGMRVHELKPGEWPVWKTEAVARKEDAPIGAEVPGSVVELGRGKKKRVALVYTNAGDKPVYFFAAPHIITPAQESLGFKFRCLCVNQAYTVPAGYTWYRVVELRVGRDFGGDRLDVLHRLVALDAEKARQFNAGMANELDPDK